MATDKLNPDKWVSFLTVSEAGEYSIVLGKFRRMFATNILPIEMRPPANNQGVCFYTAHGINGIESQALANIFTGLIALCGNL